MELRELIRQHQHDDHHLTAKAVIDAIPPRQWRDVLFDVVKDECRRLYRNTQRGEERLAGNHETNRVATPVAGTSRGSGEVVPLEQRRAYLRRSTYCGDHGRIPTGEMTVADHEARIAFLRTLHAGIDKTIRFHEDAIAQIKAAGVTCLNDTEAVAS